VLAAAACRCPTISYFDFFSSPLVCLVLFGFVLFSFSQMNYGLMQSSDGGKATPEIEWKRAEK